MAKRKPPCGACAGTGALAAERCPECTKPRLGTLPRETRKLYLELFARSGRWEPGLFLFVNAVSPELRTEGEKARALYLAKVQPILDRSEPGEFGMIPPRDVLPAPTFAPFVPAMRPSQGGPGVEVREYRGIRIDLSKTCGGCGQKAVDKLGVCSLCGTFKRVVADVPPDLGDPAADFKRLLRGYRKSPPRVEPPTLEEQVELDEDIPF
jgi:hypothetical protein